jgi:hypothetical protein
MSTQAQGQAPAQAQAQVHPIHEEQATHELLTKIVSETPENDPHEGTDMEAPKTAEKPQEAPEAETPAEEEKIEFDEETPIFDVELKTENGKETQKLSLKEMRAGYQRMQDYHRNIQKVKAQEAELSTRAQQAEMKAAQEYMQRLEVHKQAVAQLAGVKTMPEIEALSRQDPAAAQQEFLRMISVNQTLQKLEAEQGQARQKLHEQQQAAMHTAIQQSRSTLESKIPGWGEELYKNVLGTVAKDYGFKNEEVAPVVDARLIEVFHDAYQYRQLQRAKPEISKKVVAVPKVVKPGSVQSQSTSSTAAQEAEQRLKKSGRGEDFVAWYLAQQKQQKRK